MKCTIYIFLCLLACATMLSAQEVSQDLPAGFAPGEKARIPAYSAQRQLSAPGAITAPPASPVRTMAEWEELQALVVSWKSYPEVLIEIVRYAKEECEVIIVCTNENTVKNQLGGAGVDWTENITFLEAPFNSVWVRDYGPNTVYLNTVDTLAFVDWIYNRPRPADDASPNIIANSLGIPIYSTTTQPYDLVNTGGNFMADGMHTDFSSTLVLEENGPGNVWGTSVWEEEDIDMLMNQFMGIERYIKMPTLPYDNIHHIDMHMKLLDEETILVGKYPNGVADGPQIEANIAYILENFQTPYGNDYEIVRIPMPSDNGNYPNNGGRYFTYANAIIVNKTILVPTYNIGQDQIALNIWQEAMPGYNIQGIDCTEIIYASGALHCITKEVGVTEPLLIQHEKIRAADTNTPITVEADIFHQAGISEATVHYRAESSDTYTPAPMTDADSDNTWEATIPTQGDSVHIRYYISATANSGKSITRPMTAPEGYWEFNKQGPVSSTQSISFSPTELSPAFPNPANAITCIPVQSNYTQTATITLTDVLGKRVKTIFTGQLPAGESKHFIYAGHYAPGTYFIRLQTENAQAVQKLIIK